MIQIHPEFVAKVEAAENGEDLAPLLQHALRLEHATIPPYLTAAYSLKQGSNGEVIGILKDIAKEEMLHMSMVANIINAVGGRPDIAGEDFIPKYPDKLPMSIGSLTVGLKKFSQALVRDVFMEIEKSDKVLDFPVVPMVLERTEETFSTIGTFYTAIADRIKKLGDGIFTGNVARQVVVDAPDPWTRLKRITNVESAVEAIEYIKEDGEGTSTLPFDQSGQLAHYFRFAEIANGRKLIQTPAAPGFAYGGDPIVIDASRVWDLPDNPKAADYASGTAEREVVDLFNQTYSDMLRALQVAFDGQPDTIRQAIVIMGELRSIAAQAVELIDPGTGKSLGLTYEYMPPV